MDHPAATGAPAANQAVPPQVKAIIALAIVLRAAVALATRYTAEDYMITLRYAENLARGYGMVYNVGERVLGTTTPLYTLFLALAAWLHFSPTVCGTAINILADGALCLVLYVWLRREGFEKAGRIAAFLAAVHPIHVRWAISGMETSLVTAAGIWAWYAYSRRRYVETYLALGILFLLRWDSLLLTAVVTAAILWLDRRLPLRAICLFALIVAPWIIVAGRYYGSPIPVTGQAKVQVYGWFADHLAARDLRTEAAGYGQGLTALIKYEPTWLLRRLPRQQKLLNLFVGSPVPLLLTLTAAVGLGRVVKLRSRALAPPIAWLLLYSAAFLLSRVLLFEWYLVPPFPVFEILAAIGITRCAERAARSVPHRTRLPMAAAAITLAAVGPTLSLAAVLRRSQRIEETARKPIGLWLNANSKPGDRILLEPIGYIGYYSQRRIIDVIGLVSPQVLPFYGPSATSPWLAQIQHFQPEWCVLRPAEAEDIERAAATHGFDWKSDYTLAHTRAFSSGGGEKPLIFHVYHRIWPVNLQVPAP